MNTLFPFALFQATVVFAKGASHGSFHASDGTIPSPPLDVAVARLEQDSFYDKTTGIWCNPQKETHSHYHTRLSRIRSVEPLIVPSTLVVSPELHRSLGAAHRDFLRQEFVLVTCLYLFVH